MCGLLEEMFYALDCSTHEHDFFDFFNKEKP
jgi:hypothetical protein